MYAVTPVQRNRTVRSPLLDTITALPVMWQCAVVLLRVMMTAIVDVVDSAITGLCGHNRTAVHTDVLCLRISAARTYRI
jgi:hypothetical protein